MNNLFKLPLHGVFCVPFCGANKQELPLEITLSFSHFTVDETLKPIWSMIDEGERYHSEVSLYKATSNEPYLDSDGFAANKSVDASYYLNINCQGTGSFKVSKTNITIDWQAQGTGADHYFQTLALALNLELNNVLCIHANVLAYQDKAIAFVAPSRTGKTTLTAALSQQGFGLMTDDMMALHYDDEKNDYTVYPSWPVARMWPDSLAELVGENSVACEKVHENFAKRIVTMNNNSIDNSSTNNENISFNFCAEPKKLKVIYLLQRHETITAQSDKEAFCTISDIPAAQAVIILLQNSILGSAYSALGIEGKRVVALAKLLNNINFKQLSYSSGKKNLFNVAEKIKQDINL
ncbi:hypothetical protein [Colwellia sp. TT2012]|uniref:hypothetical protein n=1 Tax=Colwellia sp. TT2012 TaxID=1720342 RepID=UPI00070B2035|nr:hypothetical protein [Colwellia sp. TT2012]